jgi:uncharacterized phage-like protein YoqJ
VGSEKFVIAGTGHRPEDIEETEDEVRAKIRSALLELSPDAVITGMASGFDLYLGSEALDMGIETWAARPWAGHTPRRSEDAQYARIVAEATKVIDVNVSAVYLGPWMYQDRNVWMVDHANNMLAYWSGKKKGGTYNCLKYMSSVNKTGWNLYGEQRTLLG